MTTDLTGLQILCDDERRGALSAIARLRALGPAARVSGERDSIERVSLDCVEAVLHLKGLEPEAVRCFLSGAVTMSSLGIDVEASVLLDVSDTESQAVSLQLGQQLGVDDWVPPALESDRFRSDAGRALEYIRGLCPEAAQVTVGNSGLILPYRCPPPVSGSSSALQLPGVLLLPAGVPSLILAEYWLHECLHNELYLAEWCEGAALATADATLDTPWREMRRPASMLLHGAFVFSCIAAFMRRHRNEYQATCGDWHLSATPARRISYSSIDTAITMRVTQVEEALRTLRSSSVLSGFGCRVADACHRIIRASSAW